MKIIGLSGKMGSGKNYISEQLLYRYFKDKYNILIIGFGDLMKNELYARDKSLLYDELYDHKTFVTRQKLQQYGTENGRDKYHEDIWVRGLDIQIETFNRRCGPNALIIICDIRFVNEFEYVKSKGGKNIRIISPNRTHDRYFREASGDITKLEVIKNHRSEISLDNHSFDYIIKNDYNDVIDFDYDILI
jgi:phosphomevalonate kinase